LSLTYTINRRGRSDADLTIIHVAGKASGKVVSAAKAQSKRLAISKIGTG
jgi:hypothetical protein